MRAIPASFQAKLYTGATTLCRCWRVDRADGASLGFTDHDEDLVFDGLTFKASAGLSASALEAAEGLAPDNHDAAGALSSDALTERDLARGAYDRAKIQRWVVDWTDPSSASSRVLEFCGEFGEIRRAGASFTVELNSLSERLNRPFGRQYLATCDAALGDTRCGVDLTSATFTGNGAVLSASADRTLTVSGLDAETPGWFSRGRLVWTSGANAGVAAAVKLHRREGGTVILELWDGAPEPIALGDAFAVTAGCDKSADTCRTKFANFERFRGFPHIPGDDWVVRYPTSGETHDGRSLRG